MGTTHSCDEAGECVVRACQFSKHTNDDIKHGQGTAEDTTVFSKDVDDKLKDFFNGTNVMSRKEVYGLRDLITSSLTENMDINAGCIGFADATGTPVTKQEETKKESFTRSSSLSSLITCVVIAITLTIALIFAWRMYFCNRNRTIDTINESSTRTPDESTNDLR